MLAQQTQIKTAIVLAKAGWHAGVIGIVASRLVDKYHLPTILISIDGEMAKGSCRSIPSLNLYEAIRECAEELIQFGGHHQAAGLTLRTARIEEFRQHFSHVVAGRLQPEDFEPKLKVDLLLEARNSCPAAIKTVAAFRTLRLRKSVANFCDAQRGRPWPPDFWQGTEPFTFFC
jgi:single-stranded-DNA-specific exonuclease